MLFGVVEQAVGDRLDVLRRELRREGGIGGGEDGVGLTALTALGLLGGGGCVGSVTASARLVAVELPAECDGDDDGSCALPTFGQDMLPVWGGGGQEEEVDDAAEVLCDLPFGLAYGNKVLLRKTKLKLLRGHKYGLLGQNDSGKTSLLNAQIGRAHV